MVAVTVTTPWGGGAKSASAKPADKSSRRLGDAKPQANNNVAAVRESCCCAAFLHAGLRPASG
ncbi:hypothetical protein ACNKHP_23010 [Shigella boydii]